MSLGGTAAAGTSALINGAQIKDHTIALKKLTPPAIAALLGRQGESGPAGDPGPAGPQGPPGGFDPNKVAYVQGPTSSVAPGVVATLSATCPSGTKVIAGGGYTSVAIVGASLANSTGWSLVVANASSIQLDGLYAFAVCASP